MSTSGSSVTTDHDKIREWVENRGGKPARVKGTGDGRDAGLLRIDFPDGREEQLEAISWEEFFRKFDEKQLAFLYQDEGASGNSSRFNKLIERSREGSGGS